MEVSTEGGQFKSPQETQRDPWMLMLGILATLFWVLSLFGVAFIVLTAMLIHKNAHPWAPIATILTGFAHLPIVLYAVSNTWASYRARSGTGLWRAALVPLISGGPLLVLIFFFL